ncbi:glycine N-acyltransferase [Larimichthys crocea]|uniref:glycine N-acyltransferase n=1 Tax=Larimichthys crocea TaxID=215358 RepID=UPI000F5F4278|nr:glycine N-acyltransferase [Larimichthys crocea]
MELTGDQLKLAETQLKRYLPQSLQVYGYLVLINRSDKADPVKVLVDKWPEFSVIICRPQYKKKGDLFKDTQIFANDEGVLKETIKKSSVFDWTRYICLGNSKKHFSVSLCCISLHQTDVLKAVASEKEVPSKELAVCHMMILEDVLMVIIKQDSSLLHVSSGISLGSLDESHTGLVNQTWKFAKNDEAVRMIRNMLANFPSCCVLDAEGKPVSWIMSYPTCAMGMLYTLPEHRGKGYAKVLVSTMAKRFHAEGYPVYCFIEEENVVSYKLFKSLGFTEDPSYRATWFHFNNL